MTSSRGGAVLLLLVAATSSSPADARQSRAHMVDFNYAPLTWLTPIGFVDDWQKSLVDERGRLAYDFGPGPYVRPKTTVSIELAGDDPADSARQRLLSAKLPVVVTETGFLTVTAFSLIERQAEDSAGESPKGRYLRREGITGSLAWAPAQEGVDPAFRSVAWGTGRSVPYDLFVRPGERHRVAVGFNEVYRRGRISRLMDIIVEGAETRTVDLMQTGEQSVPQVFFFDAVDADNNGVLTVEVTASARGQDPNVFVNGIWLFHPDDRATVDEVVSGAATTRSTHFVDAGAEMVAPGRVRMDALRGSRKEGAGPLRVRIETLRPLTTDAATGTVYFAEQPFVVTRPAFVSTEQVEGGMILEYPEETHAVDVVVVHGAARVDSESFPELGDELRKATSYWQHVSLPWGRIRVPDQGVQDLLDGSIRTLYQVREVVDGHPQFQPGATVYRGLWYGDGMWAVEAVAYLDDGEAARRMLDAMMLHQDGTGRAGVMKPALLHRETAHLVYAMARYARLHRDWEWLDRHWAHLARAVDFIIALRRSTLEEEGAAYRGLFPPGLTDGGVGGVGASYGSVYWGLIALAEAVRTAEAIGHPKAASWREAFESFLASFREAADRDMREDEFGNRFLPIKMDFDPDNDVAQRGQWGPIHALYAGRFFDDDDPLVTGTLAMLEAHTEEEHVVSLGWLDGGVWPIFEAHRALAYNWLRQPDHAERLLYAFANHASPTMVWVEEQMPKGKGARTTGDVPHTVGNMQAVRLIRNLLIHERGDDLELMHSIPLTWLHPGARLELTALPTLFGPVTLSLEITADGQAGSVFVITPESPDEPAGHARLSTRRLREAGFANDAVGESLPEEIAVPWGSAVTIGFRRR